MTTEATPKSEMDLAAEDLFGFAIDREDVKWLLARLPKEAGVKPTAVEYELQLLKIITVGWGITFYLENSPRKQPLAERFWASVHEFSRNLSTTTELMIGQDIDYFMTLRERLDTYVAALEGAGDTGEEPAQRIGPTFAHLCGDREDLFAFMTGSRMFKDTIARVKAYLSALKWC